MDDDNEDVSEQTLREMRAEYDGQKHLSAQEKSWGQQRCSQCHEPCDYIEDDVGNAISNCCGV